MTAPNSSPAPLDTSTLQRVLVVVAHPDDAEYGTSAAVATWTAAGVEVAYLLLTAGEAGMQRPPEEAGPLRAHEQQAACDAVGVSRLTILDFPDGTLEYSLGLRRAIAREIRTFRPDTVVCGSGELMVQWGVDHADHRVAGVATLDAVRDADNRWVFPELARGEDLAPWGVSRLLLIGGVPFPEPVMMFWNFVGRTRDELASAASSWNADDGRFGTVASPLDRIASPRPWWATGR